MTVDVYVCVQREERKILREWKAWLDQLERDILRAQGTEGNLTEKYQVTQLILEADSSD